jgi:arabinogalactan oligomer / maltooligosaccharide transport system substrate-binding protein
VKKYLMMFFVALMTLVLSACDDDTKKDPSDNNGGTKTGYQYNFSETKKETTTIRVWADDTDGIFMDKLIEEFNKIHPEIIVKFQHMATTEAREKLQLLGPSGKGADIFQFPHDHLAPALEADLVYALPDQVATKLNERMSEISMSIATACYDFDAPEGTNAFACTGSNENVFAYPLSVESIALFYNKDLLDELGLEPATSFEELITQSQTYNDHAATKYLLNTNFDDSYFMNFFFTAFGYKPFGDDFNNPDQVNLNSEAVIKGLNYIKNNIVPLYGSGTNNTSIQALADPKFEAGELPYIITGPWKIETYKDLDFEVGVTTIPTINIDGEDVAPKPFVGAQMAAIYKYTENYEAAVTFLDYWTSYEGLNHQYDIKGKLPALKEELMDNIPAVDADPYLQGIRAQIENTIPMPTIPEIQQFWDPAKFMVQEVWKGTHTPEQAALRAENAYNADRSLRE